MMRSDELAHRDRGVADDRRARIEAFIASLPATKGLPIKRRFADFPDLLGFLFEAAPLADERLDGEDLQGLDFTGANFTGASFAGARIRGARFEQARVARWQLRMAADWVAYLQSWEPPTRRPGRFVWPGDRFSLAPFAPELIGLQAPEEMVRPDNVADTEWAAFEAGKLAIAIMPLTTWEHEVFVRSRERNVLNAPEAASSRPEPARLTPREALDYVEWVSDRAGVLFSVPSRGLWYGLAELGGLPAKPSGDAGITAEVARGARRPITMNERASPGRDRCNALGLIDMIGNTREYVRLPEGDLLYTLGEEFDETLERCLSSIERLQLGHPAIGTECNGLRLICILE
jgi:hypothetical protein